MLCCGHHPASQCAQAAGPGLSYQLPPQLASLTAPAILQGFEPELACATAASCAGALLLMARKADGLLQRRLTLASDPAEHCLVCFGSKFKHRGAPHAITLHPPCSHNPPTKPCSVCASAHALWPSEATSRVLWLLRPLRSLIHPHPSCSHAPPTLFCLHLCRCSSPAAHQQGLVAVVDPTLTCSS